MKDWLMDSINVKDKENVTCSGNDMKGEVNPYNFFPINLNQQLCISKYKNIKM